MSHKPAESPERFAFGEVLKDWSTYTAIGTFLLYLFGYLALRFHLTALGVNSDLGVLDEEYLFAGAHFLAYLASSLPWLALLAFLVIAITWTIRKMLSTEALHRVKSAFHQPLCLIWFSLIVAIASIQLLLNRCFALDDLAFNGIPADLGFLRNVLMSNHGSVPMLFFVGLVLAAFLVTAPLVVASRLTLDTPGLRFLFRMAAALALATILLVPVNFGALILPYPAERTNTIGKKPVTAAQRAWIIWRGKDWLTYLVRTPNGKSLVDVPLKGLDDIEVLNTGSLFDALAETVQAPQAEPVLTTVPDPPNKNKKETKSTAPPQQSLAEKLARVVGVDRTPRTLRSASAAIAAGELWISSVDQSNPSRLGSASDLRSPVLQPNGKLVFAMEGETLVRVARSDGSLRKIADVPGIVKLVGIHMDRPDRILAILGAGNGAVKLVDLAADSGNQELLAGNQSTDDPMTRGLLGWERRYDNVYVTPEGPDIIVQGTSPYPVNVSRCRPDICGQPSYAPASKEIVFIRSHRN